MAGHLIPGKQALTEAGFIVWKHLAVFDAAGITLFLRLPGRVIHQQTRAVIAAAAEMACSFLMRFRRRWEEIKAGRTRVMVLVMDVRGGLTACLSLKCGFHSRTFYSL